MARLDTTPILFSAKATLAGSAPTTLGILPSEGLQNFLDSPVEIHGLSFDLAVTAPGGPSSLRIEASLRFGRYAITNGFVPLTALAPRRDSLTRGGYTSLWLDNAFRWEFAKPFLLGSGESIAGAFRFNSALTPGVDELHEVYVTAYGQRIPKKPIGRRAVPFATGFTFAAPGALPSAQPTDPQVFKNTFRKPLEITSINLAANGSNNLVIPPSDAAKIINVTITGPGGVEGRNRRTVASDVMADAAFGGRLAIEVPHTLDPGDWYKVEVRAPRGVSTATTIMVAMTGFREE